MTIKRRIENLENTMAPKQLHAPSFISGKQTEQEAVEQYCAKKGFDTEKFKKEEYGRVIIIENEIIKPKPVAD